MIVETKYDEWFKEEKEKLEKLFAKQVIESVSSGKDYQKEKLDFEKKLTKLCDGFEEKNYREIKFDKWKKLLIKPVNKLNEGMDTFVKAFREEK